MKKSELENNEDYVECKDCGHIVAKGRAQVVNLTSVRHKEVFTETYCELHKKPYQEKRSNFAYDYEYYSMLQVSKDGTPIGYKKITPKK